MVDPLSSSGGDEGREALHHFVRERRLRLPPESHVLGASARLPARVGRPVTQEELAEHLGVSRQWYARFESGTPAGFSAHLLTRLSDLLLLSGPERAELLRLTMPQLGIVSGDSSALYEALRDVRRAVKRLWSASSEAELFQLAGEEARRLLPYSELIWVQRESLFAPDETLFPQPRSKSAARLAAARDEAIRRFTPEQLALLDTLIQGVPPGEILPFEAYPLEILGVVELALRDHGLSGSSLSLTAARIRGSRGFGGAVVSSSTRQRDVSELEQAALGAIADFASLALR